jgi:hypothetical protein
VNDPPPDQTSEASTGGSTLLDWLFRNRRTGQITVDQFPKPALWAFMVVVVGLVS